MNLAHLQAVKGQRRSEGGKREMGGVMGGKDEGGCVCGGGVGFFLHSWCIHIHVCER